MSLDIHYVAICDRCDERVVLFGRDRTEAVTAVREMGWKVDPHGRGAELFCSGCVELNEADMLAMLGAYAPGTKGDYRLKRPRYRMGWRACRRCASFFTYDALVFWPLSKEHVANLACDSCALGECTARGFRGWVDVPLADTEGAPMTHQ